MQALSIRQPWAYLIAAGHKDIENRNWPKKYRGRIYIHAGKAFDSLAPSNPVFQRVHLPQYLTNYIEYLRFHRPELFGAIIGEVDIVDCVTESDSPWFEGPYGFVLERPVLYGKPHPCRGQLKMFTPPMVKVDGGGWRLA